MVSLGFSKTLPSIGPIDSHLPPTSIHRESACIRQAFARDFGAHLATSTKIGSSKSWLSRVGVVGRQCGKELWKRSWKCYLDTFLNTLYLIRWKKKDLGHSLEAAQEHHWIIYAADVWKDRERLSGASSRQSGPLPTAPRLYDSLCQFIDPMNYSF